jgi:hyperosmotically inducible protein
MKPIPILLLGAAVLGAPVLAAGQSTSDTTESRTEAVKEKAKATSDTAKAGTTDAWITSKTKIALYGDDRVHATRVNVETHNGVVRLRGKVDSAEEKAAAEAVAKSIDGVTAVRNSLEVVPASDRKTVDAKDDDIAKTVRQRLRGDAQLKDADIEVRADKGVVTLMGKVENIRSRAHASEVARRVPGVRSVKNELQERS